ncbi:MAG: GreA/GreB family elongation factor [Planctomycetales bacterium]|nr:GreA/GreB family elongation factor [Planctomycetales bacterium]
MSAMTRGERALAAAEAGNAAAAEDLWLEALTAGEAADPAFASAAKILVTRGEKERAAVLLGMTAPLLESAGRGRETFEVLSILARLTPAEPGLRDRIASAAAVAWREHPQAREIVETLRLEGPPEPGELAEALRAAFAFASGDVVRHNGGWGVGRISRLDARRLQIVVDFPGASGRAFPLRTAGGLLSRVPPDAFDALAVAAPEKLREEAAREPANLVKRLLRDRGGKATLREVKGELVPRLVADGDWTRFWGAARKALQADPFVEVGSGANAPLAMRERPVTRGEDVLARVRRAADLADKLREVRASRREVTEPALLAAIAAEVATEAAGVAASDRAGRAAVALALEEVGAPAGAGAPPADLAALAADPAAATEVLSGLSDPAHRSAFLGRVRAARPADWGEVVCGVLQRPSVPGAYEAVAEACRSAGGLAWDLFRTAAARAAAPSARVPAATLWIAGEVIGGRVPAGPPFPDEADLLARALELLTHASADAEWGRDAQAKEVLRRGREALSADSLIAFLERRAAEEMPRLSHAVLGCRGLTGRVKAEVERWVARHHPDALVAPSLEEEPIVPPGTIVVSAAGFAKRQAEFAQLMNVEIPKNQVELGEAIAKGDLAENAEYDAARERQRILLARAGEMKAELEKVHVLDLASVKADRAQPGTRVLVLGAGGEREAYTLLGPWDVDVARGIISYLSPIGKALLGRQAGDDVRARLPEGERSFRIEAIETLGGENA